MPVSLDELIACRETIETHREHLQRTGAFTYYIRVPEEVDADMLGELGDAGFTDVVVGSANVSDEKWETLSETIASLSRVADRLSLQAQ